MKIYTRVGDHGMTKQASGKMVAKNDLQIQTLGAIDELESRLGVTVAGLSDECQQIKYEIQCVQKFLYELQADIAVCNHHTVTAQDTIKLEQHIDDLHAQVTEIKEFILPGGKATGANLQYARTIARRAERMLAAYAQQATVNDEILMFMNRLSDYLFVLARYANKLDGYQDIPTSKI